MRTDRPPLNVSGGGEGTAPSPVDRRKKGTRHTGMVDKDGVPLVIPGAGAGASDHTRTMPVIPDFPQVGGAPGRPGELPDEAYADRGHDGEPPRASLRWLGIEPRIANPNTEHGGGLGKVRWVVERTIGWLKGLRR